MTKTEIYTRLAELQEGALGLLTDKLRSFNRHCIDKELERPEGDEDYSYIASCAIDLDYLEGINNEINDILRALEQ
tara:strand:+ start:1725 stop:1952 length:228 start_codon:yes stop_codon:yes gene_type:complete